MTKAKKIATAALVVLIAGCGGGGSSAPGIDTSSLKIDGDVFKGAMANAKVSLYKPTAEGKQGDLLGNTTTNGNGNYSVAVNGYNGVMIMEASVVPGTTMYDEATQQAIVPAADFVMRASFLAEAGKTYTAQINPFTDLSTSMALAKAGGLNATNVAQANKDLAESLPFNPLTFKPEFDAITKAPKNAAAAIVAAVSFMANSGELGCTTAGDQAAKVSCVVKALSKSGLADAGVKASLQKFTKKVAADAGLPEIIIGSPSGTAPSAASPVEQAKAFIATLRGTAKALSELTLQADLQAVAKDITGGTVRVAKESIDALNVARLGIQFRNDFIENPSSYSSATRGSCTLYTSAEYTTEATSATGANYVECFAPLNAKVRLQATAGNSNEFTMSTGSILPAVATLTTTRNGTGPVTAATLVGELSSTAVNSKYNVNLSAALSKVDDLDKLAVSGSIDLVNSATKVSIERIELAAGSYLQAKLVDNSAQDESEEMLLKLKASTADSAVSGDVKLSAFKRDASGTSYIPTMVSFAGSVQRKGVSFFEGMLTGEALNHAIFKSNMPINTGNAQQMRVGFAGKVVIPGQPDLNVKLSMVNNDTGSRATDTASLGGQYRQGATVINLIGNTSMTNNILVLSNSEGVALVIDKSKATYPLTKNGELLGNYSASTSRIDYTDSSYEQY